MFCAILGPHFLRYSPSLCYATVCFGPLGSTRQLSTSGMLTEVCFRSGRLDTSSAAEFLIHATLVLLYTQDVSLTESVEH
jgi:hypothetical protein